MDGLVKSVKDLEAVLLAPLMGPYSICMEATGSSALRVPLTLSLATGSCQIGFLSVFGQYGLQK
jgi:hypothetical protein